jgi:hypothetical protein
MTRLAGSIRCAAICALLTVIFTGAAAAQISLGAKAGMSVANVTGDDMENTSWRNGFGGGVFLTWAVYDKLSIQPEVLFVQKGAKVTFDEDEEEFTGKFRVEYFEVPVLLRLDVPFWSERASIHLIGGPSLAFKSKCEIAAEESGVEVKFDCDDEEFDSPLKSTDWSVIGGAGLGVRMRNATLFLEGRYGAGLATIDDSTPADDVKHQTFLIMAGVSIPIGGGIYVAAR